MTIIDQPIWQRCDTCGKRGTHEHSERTLALSALYDAIRDAEHDIEEYDGPVRDNRSHVHGAGCINTYPDCDETAMYPDPEHEPDNPTCLCFQRSCRDNGSVAL